jgi:hypothetical protein
MTPPVEADVLLGIVDHPYVPVGLTEDGEPVLDKVAIDLDEGTGSGGPDLLDKLVGLAE